MIPLFWAAAAIVVYAYLGYPLWMYLLSRFCPSQWTRTDATHSVSVVMAVHNGARLVRQRVERLLSLHYPGGLNEVIVVSDGSDDDTNQILGEFSDPRVIPIICPEHRGKANALNHGIRQATGDVLVFVDIRPQMEEQALQRLVSNFGDPNVGCVAGELCLRTDDHDGSTKAVSNLYWRYEQWIRKCESLVDSPVGVYGGFYAVRRELAVTIPEGLILDDMYQPLSIVRQGYRSVIDEQARVWDVWPKTSAAEFHRKIRTLAGNYQLISKAHWLLGSANRLRFQLISHKLLRLAVPFLLLVLLATSWELRASLPYALFGLGQLFGYSLALLGLTWDIPALRRITGPASAFVLLNAAAAHALLLFLVRPHSLLGLWVKREAAEPGTVSAA